MLMIYLFPHLPKTAGSTLRQHLKLEYEEGEEFFHLAPNGRKSKKLLSKGKQYEANSSFNRKLILFGHEVDEGLLRHHSSNEIVELTTLIRNPLKRVVSHYNMKKTAGSTHATLSNYIKSASEPMCKWFISNFPSFIDDIWAPIAIQAEQVLRHFHYIDSQDRGGMAMKALLARFDVKYCEEKSINIGGKSYKKHSVDESLDIEDLQYLKSDFAIYEKFKSHNSGIQTKISDLPEIKTYHRWLLPFTGTLNTIKEKGVRDDLLTSLNNELLRGLIEAYSIGYKDFVLYFFESYEIDYDDVELLDNILELLNNVTIKTDHKVLKGASYTGTDPIKLIFNDAVHSGSRLSDYSSHLWEKIALTNTSLEGRAAYLLEKKEFLAAETLLVNALKRKPLSLHILKKLSGVYYETARNEELFKVAIKACEIKPSCLWALEIINKSV